DIALLYVSEPYAGRYKHPTLYNFVMTNNGTQAAWSAKAAGTGLIGYGYGLNDGFERTGILQRNLVYGYMYKLAQNNKGIYMYGNNGQGWMPGDSGLMVYASDAAAFATSIDGCGGFGELTEAQCAE